VKRQVSLQLVEKFKKENEKVKKSTIEKTKTIKFRSRGVVTYYWKSI